MTVVDFIRYGGDCRSNCDPHSFYYINMYVIYIYINKNIYMARKIVTLNILRVCDVGVAVVQFII